MSPEFNTAAIRIRSILSFNASFYSIMSAQEGSKPQPFESLNPAEAICGRWLRGSVRALAWLTEPLLKFNALDQCYQDLRQRRNPNQPFFETGLAVLNARLKISEADLERIPKEGPVIVVCNHPFGGIDGVAVGALLQRIRSDSKLMVNFMLGRLEGIEPHVVQVDPFGGEDSKSRNLKGVRDCLSWLKQGGLLATWPAGTVSHLHVRKRQVTDPQWAENLAILIRRSKATVVPVYIPGRNSWFFQLAGCLHPRLRTLLLPREMMARRGSQIEIRVGSSISAARLDRFTSDRQLMDYLRLRSYILQSRKVAERLSFRQRFHRRYSRGKAIAAAQPAEVLQREIDQLPAAQKLTEHNEYAVYYGRAQQMPRLIMELGRLRELTFRAVGEGTGKAVDLDPFDQTYLHLFLWNHAKSELVGAYRLGPTDEILPLQGKHGLYTATLFRYRSEVLRRLNPALELGRSFIVDAYQRKHMTLGLIWRGIGEYIARHPRYAILFGPVSISREYQSLSKNLIVHYLNETNLDPDLSSKIKARKPPRSRFFGSLDKGSFSKSVRDIEDVSALISEIEREVRGVPVLLRHYLKLKATMLSFNVDPDFNDCIDGLVLVDLRSTPVNALERYLGKTGAQKFLSYHEVRQPEPESTSVVGIQG